MEKLKGKFIQFHAHRIQNGNPVKGVVKKEYSNGDIDVQLAHDIEGLTTIWYAGDVRLFKKQLISDIKILLT